MKKLSVILIAAALALILAACTAGAAGNTGLEEQYLPQGVEFIKTEKDDGFTEHKYRDSENNKYTLIVDAAGSVRALEYDSTARSKAESVVLTSEEAFAAVTAVYPEARLITAAEDRDDGRWEWDLLFTDGSVLGFYEIDASDGTVLDYELLYYSGSPIDPVAIITANLPNAVVSELSLDTDDGRLYIEGEASAEKGVIEFTIDADTGTIVEMEYDD